LKNLIVLFYFLFLLVNSVNAFDNNFSQKLELTFKKSEVNHTDITLTVKNNERELRIYSFWLVVNGRYYPGKCLTTIPGAITDKFIYRVETFQLTRPNAYVRVLLEDEMSFRREIYKLNSKQIKSLL